MIQLFRFTFHQTRCKLHTLSIVIMQNIQADEFTFNLTEIGLPHIAFNVAVFNQLKQFLILPKQLFPYSLYLPVWFVVSFYILTKHEVPKCLYESFPLLGRNELPYRFCAPTPLNNLNGLRRCKIAGVNIDNEIFISVLTEIIAGKQIYFNHLFLLIDLLSSLHQSLWKICHYDFRVASI